MKKLINKLKEHFNVSETTFLDDIASHITEAIKSDLRKSVRYDISMYRLMTAMQNEFGQSITDKQLIEVAKLARDKLRASNINLYVDNEGLVAGRPITLNESHSLA